MLESREENNRVGEKERERRQEKKKKRVRGKKNDCPLRESLYEALHIQEVPITSTSAGEERGGRVVCGLKYRQVKVRASVGARACGDGFGSEGGLRQPYCAGPGCGCG